MHTITSKADQGKSFDSGILKPNAEFTFDASKLAQVIILTFAHASYYEWKINNKEVVSNCRQKH